MAARIRDDVDEAFVMQDKATNRARRLATAKKYPGRNTLFEYACSLESNLSKVAKEIRVWWIHSAWNSCVDRYLDVPIVNGNH